MDKPSVYAGAIFVAILLRPLQLVLSIGGTALSRHHERKADSFAATTTGRGDLLASGLKGLIERQPLQSHSAPFLRAAQLLAPARARESAGAGTRPLRVTRSSGLLRVGLAAVIWGSIPIFVRMVDTSPFVLVFWRVAFGAAAMLAYLLLTGKVRDLARLDRRRVLALLAVGALIAVNWVLFLGALTMTRVAVAELLAYTGPVFVAALAPLISASPTRGGSCSRSSWPSAARRSSSDWVNCPSRVGAACWVQAWPSARRSPMRL